MAKVAISHDSGGGPGRLSASQHLGRRWRIGDRVIMVIPIANILLWLLFLPDDDGTRPQFARQLAGEVVGSTMVLLLACVLVLSTRARFLEPYFGGLDKMYRAHKDAALVAFLLLFVHFALVPLNTASVKPGTPAGMIAGVGIVILVVLTVAPRVPILRRFMSLTYDRWRSSHRFIGVFFIIGLAHMMLVDPLVKTTVVPFVVLLLAFVIGIVSYLYTVLLARFFRRTRRYVVRAVRPLNRTTVEVTLLPRKKKRIEFTAGQFLFVRFKAKRPLSKSHPFTISSSPRESELRLTIKAGGDFTDLLQRRLTEGTRATLVGCYGLFDYKRGGPEQIWVAGGIGITPFLSWIRDLGDDPLDREVDFFYTVRAPADALFLDEIRAATLRHRNLRAHLNYSATDGTLTAEKIAATSPGPITAKDIYLCGPSRMTEGLHRRFRRLGVPPSSIHFEEFNFR